AVDAAVAMAIALTVVEPTSNGIGSDAFALVWDGQLHGLNASGRSPQSFTPEKFAKLNLSEMPKLGWLTVTVPGAVSAWYNLWQRWGRLSFEHLFEPAIRYAEEGFPVSPITAQAWKRAEHRYLPLKGKEYQPFKHTFFPHDRAPKPGEIWHSAVHGYTLRSIAKHGEENFYRGEMAEQIVHFADDTGGCLTLEDLKAHSCDWVTPVSTQYRDLTVWEMPPNTQGIAALMALNILEGFDLQQYPRDSAESFHLQIEAMKLAFADIHQHLGDPQAMQLTPSQLLNRDYAKQRQKLIRDRALPTAEPGFIKGGTVYLCASDGELMVSLIQSNYEDFGSGILIPDTGIALHNRGACFTLEEGHPNQVAPNKRPFHTIIPGFLSQEGQPLGPFGVMGGQMQPQGHLQVVVNLADYQMNPQSALDAPRWRFLRDNHVILESGVADHIAPHLERRGHQVAITSQSHHFGKGQMILQNEHTLMAASEPRADGCAIAF
ncbi:MAG: gamma-glutamyltransferase family protein, partial [Kamptonema sp. SIO4C4]|nr:gamma-glutamyltransferase family protein [Kamptonema sp. SIO4C4]